MSEKNYFIIFVAFVVSLVVMHVRALRVSLPVRAGATLCFLIITTVVGSWIVSLRISGAVFGVAAMGWQPYLKGTVYVAEKYRNVAYLSDGRTIVGWPCDLYQYVFAASFFIALFAIGATSLKILRWMSPRTAGMVLKLLSHDRQGA